MKFDEYAAQVSLGTLSPQSVDEWLSLIMGADEPCLLSRLFTDYFSSSGPQQSISNNSMPGTPASAWATLMKSVDSSRTSPAKVDQLVIQILANPSCDLSVFETMIGSARLAEKHICLIAFSHLVTAEIVEKWNSLYPGVLACNTMQLKRVFEKSPRQVLYYAEKQLNPVVTHPMYDKWTASSSLSERDYSTVTGAMIKDLYAKKGDKKSDFISWSMNSGMKPEEDKK